MDNLIKSSPFKLPLPAFSIITLFVVLMIVGLAVIPLLSVQLNPSRTSKSVTINFNWNNASAKMLEHGVTAKLEGVLSSVKGVKNIRSVSNNSYGYITADLDDFLNTNQTRYEIATLVRQLYPSLPEGVSFPMVSLNRSEENENRSILSYTINGPVNASAIQEYAEKNIKPKLALISDVYQVNIYGASSYAWELRYNPTQLVSYGIATQDIGNSISDYFRVYELGKANVLSNTNALKQDYIYLTLKTERNDTIEWDKIAVKKTNGRVIYLTDVAKVNYIEQEPRSFYRINGLNTVNVEIIASKNTNYIFLAKEIKEHIKSIKQTLPKGYSIMLAYDATEYLKTEINKITWRSLATLIILLVFILAVSSQLKYLLLISISLVSNLLLAFILYYFFKLEIHLYSLAGITVSIGMIIDNSIVVIDHIRHKNNMKVLLAVAGATLSTIGAISIIFFLDKQQQMKLIDFAWVIIINLGISLLVALFFIPALMEKIPLKKIAFSKIIRRKRRIVKWNRFYTKLIKFGIRHRVAYILFVILLFGIPVFMLPTKIEKENGWAKIYNTVFGNSFYNESIREWANLGLGGTLRLFLSGGDQFSYSDAPRERTSLNVRIMMPKGAQLKQMNAIAINWENYLSQFDEIEQFQTRVSSGQSAAIEILFKKEFDDGAFPNTLKNDLESKAVLTGLADFGIYGVGMGFNNQINTDNTNYALTLQGYNYENLERYADQVKQLLLENNRVEKVSIGSERDWDGAKSNYEFLFRVNNQEKLLVNQLSPSMISGALTDFSGQSRKTTDILHKGDYVPVILTPNNSSANIWQVLNEPVRSSSGAYVRLKEFASIDKERTGEQILRENQQYQMVVNYNFIGDNFLGSIVSEHIIKQVSADLPLGYSVKESNRNFWGGAKDKLTWTILLTIFIVFVICAILLDSILQPLAVIAMIPVSFIGVFLTTYLFGYRFDEGGYAAFIILCGVVVSAALYILNDYNNLLHDFPDKPRLLLFVKAYNSKIIPVILSRISIIIGLIPFIVYSVNEPFWFALAMSAIGGLLFSMVAILLLLPLFLKGNKNDKNDKDIEEANSRTRNLKTRFMLSFLRITPKKHTAPITADLKRN